MRKSLLAVTLSLLAACPGPDPKPPPGDTPVADALLSIVESMREQVPACTGTEWEAGFDFGPTAAALQASVDEGRILVEPAAMEACVASVAAFSCAETIRSWDDDPECLESLFAGNVAPGDACSEDLECAKGYCEYPLGTCPGSCVLTAGEGEDCTELPCALGLGCDAANLCVGEVTVAEGEACDALHLCPAGTACDYVATASDYLCRAPSGVGAACDEGSDCVAPLLCFGPIGGGSCRAMVSRGQPCGVPVACNPFLDYCDPDTTLCVALPGLGASCADSGRCAAGAYCDTADDLCKPPPTLGEPCGIYGACLDASFCDTSLATPTCTALPGPGADCSVSAVSDAELACEAGQFCQVDASRDFTTCAPRVAPGGTCLGRAADECVEGFYCDFVYPSPGTCAPKKAAGAACTDGSCQDGLECWGICTVEYCWN